jgi:hypothetical protein
MDEIARIPFSAQRDAEDLFKQLMASINPFTKYIIEETASEQTEGKYWTLEESIFQKT